MFDEKYNLVKMHKRNEKIIVKMGKIRKCLAFFQMMMYIKATKTIK